MKFNQVTWYSKILALALFVALPFLGFWLGVKYQEAINPSSSAVSSNPNTKTPATSSAKPTPGETKKQITTDQLTIKVTYQNGVYYYSGTIQLPNPCTKLSTDAIIMESFPEQVRIVLETKQDSSTFCAQVITPKSFSGQFSASAEATINMYLNDKLIK